MKRTLYYHPLSNFARKIRILLAEKKLDYELKEVNLQNKPDYFLKISPIGKVPVFVEEDGTVIWDSTLIAEYLDETYPEPNFSVKIGFKASPFMEKKEKKFLLGNPPLYNKR